jgi:alpha-methylacyl-CoA racemase
VTRTVRGPLDGVRVVEFAGLGPLPFAAMLLADMGADVVRVTRAGAAPGGPFELYHRGRPSVALDLKSAAGQAAAHVLVARAEILVEGYRPGVMERLGLGPDVCLAAQPALVYGRMTGYGQDGPWAARPGHDINYLALSGALDGLRRVGGRPLAPVNLVGDFAGGGLPLVTGVLAALLHARSTGEGQVIDVAMVDGVAALLTSICGRTAGGTWDPEPGTNLLDSGAHFYEVYACRDGGHVAVGAIEPQFYAALLEGLGLDAAGLPAQHDRAAWPAMKERFATLFGAGTRAEWETVFAGTDACVTPVLTLAEAQGHPHLTARATYREHHGIVQPAPAPRFSATPTALGPPPDGADLAATLRTWELTDDEVAAVLP